MARRLARCTSGYDCYHEVVTPTLEPAPSRFLWRLVFVLSAALAALAIRLAWDEPRAASVALLLLVSTMALRWWSRRRAQRMLRSGDVESIVRRWGGSFARVAHPETMGPLLTATAFAAYGWVVRAREVLRTAERGPAWDAALEHRLFLDSLLYTFEGESDRALKSAAELEKLPLPGAAPVLLDRIRVLRRGVAALARAFGHRAVDGDRSLLIQASDTSPLVHWAMRYGAAILSMDEGDLQGAKVLIDGAPTWPSESRFSVFHQEIAAELDRRETDA